MMRETKSISVLLFVALICLPSIASAQRNRPTGQSIISGRVLFADTGRPVRRATVNLYSNLNHPPVRTTPANQRGEFRFTEVAAGSYLVVAHSPGIISPLSSFAITEFGLGSNINETEHTRVTVDGRNTSRCEVRVVRAGTIKGTMTYVDKEPVVNGRIVLFRRKGGAIAPFFSDPVFTNDRGMYRIDGLPDGEYFLGVVVRNNAAEKTRSQPGLPSDYYPGVRSLTEAKPVQIQSGTEVTGINITLGDDDLRRISGVLKWRNSGELVTRGAVTLRRKNDPRVDISMTSLFRTITPPGTDRDELLMRDMMLTIMALPPAQDVDDKGEWQFEDLPSGTYIVTAYASLAKKKSSAKADADVDSDPSDPDPIFDDRRFVNREVEITIDEEDRTGITIEMTEGGRILGSVTFADGSPAPRIPVTVDHQNRPEFLLGLPQFTKQDGTFLLEGVSAGEVRLDVEFLGQQDLYLKSITLGGQDLMREPLRVNEGAEVTGVRITLEKGLATLAGRVQLKDDESPAAGAGVLLVRADPKLWHARSSRCFANTDAAGLFRLTCAPGDYLVFTWPAGGQPLGVVGEFIRSQASNARTVSLQSSEEKLIELTLVPRRKP